MVSFRDGVANAIRGSICAVIALNDDSARLFQRVVPPLAGPSDYFNFFAPLRAQLCDENPEDYEPPEPEFTGGQCPDTTYRVSWVTTRPGLPNNSFQVDRLGPIRVSRALDPGDSSDGCPSGTTFNRFTLLSGGSPVGIDSGCGVALQSISAVPLFGGADNCGNPDIDPVTPGPVERPINITYNDGDDTEINIDGTIRFGPAFSTGDFNLRVPFNLDLGGLEWSGNFQLTPTLDLTISPSFNFGGGGVDNPEIPPIDDPEETEPVTPEPGEPLIIGVIVRASIEGEQKASSIATQGIPTIYAPRLGSVSFAVNVGLVSAWTPDIDIKNRDCYIACPEPRGAVAVAASPAPGVNLTWTAVRGQPLATA